MRRAWATALVGIAFFLLLTGGSASATEFVVNSNGDGAPGACDATECTFREALTAANTGGVRDDRITFSVTGTPAFISAIGSAFPTIQSAATQGKLTIDGPGAGNLEIRRSTGFFGILSTAANSDVTINGVTISGGFTTGGAGG